MKKSKRATGNSNELFVQKFYEARGYLCHRAYASFTKLPGGRVLARSHDIFTVFDLIAKKQNEPTRWIQVSEKTRRAEKEKKLLSLPPFLNEHDIAELWLHFPGGEWKIYTFIEGRFIETAKILQRKFYEFSPAWSQPERKTPEKKTDET